MKHLRLSLVIFTLTFLMLACGSSGTEETISSDINLNTIPENEIASPVNEIASGETDYWAKENLDLRAVGELLEKAETAEEFEYLLNNEEGVNNLDLNGDGYADYISVAEYDDRDSDQRGFTLFNRFGANEIQEIASIIFNRDRQDAPGARVLLTGNEQIYGDNFNYETNWLDKSLAIADWVFGDRTERYESPYYYDNYPEDYETYNVVETPVYRTRITQYIAEPVFIQTYEPQLRNVKIKSSYKNKSIKNIYAGLAKPSREQVEFIRNNPRRRDFDQDNRGQIIREQNEARKIGKRNEKRKGFEKPGKGNKGNKERYESRNLPNRGQIIDYERTRPVKTGKESVRPDRNERKTGRPDNNFERKQERSTKQNNIEKRGGGNKGNEKKRGGGGNKGKGKKP